ncbi:MAG TPA: transcriptional regulator [Paenalcaligenes hominis]|uniref:Transcriptional regulator n=1 Tax=Paenalcaligenes hominis TaxID=643674 RepID=A0A9D2VHK4_9BURK|nr:PhaM family polyhydroxyalkanoate granule multifunctional regulatory protein [Paenalcaligenes hominis]NJB65217.1 hypothetical protein [Paenalcaligenes hominis]GGE71876.1 hypothetical protein GCM10007278_20150 [Paenalcaligenes hominis]HJH24807.1 transcriptional regulator [Paenalcaligenes hominis]
MKNNPFDIPGFAVNQDNPLLASLNMMQQIWGNMAKNPLDLATPTSAIPTIEELTKRIEELQAVESWLRLNLSMLSSTIQGLEIQRSTLTTLQAMAKSGLGAMSELSSMMAQSDEKATDANPDTTEQTEDTADDSLRQAGQAWWDLLQNQFETLATATAQSMQQAQSVADNLSAGVASPSADSTFKSKQAAQTAAAKKTGHTTSATKTTKTTSKSAAKKAAKKTAKAAKKTS